MNNHIIVKKRLDLYDITEYKKNWIDEKIEFKIINILLN